MKASRAYQVAVSGVHSAPGFYHFFHMLLTVLTKAGKARCFLFKCNIIQSCAFHHASQLFSIMNYAKTELRHSQIQSFCLREFAKTPLRTWTFKLNEMHSLIS